MTRRRLPSSEWDERRASRIRELREQRDAPVRRRRAFQPVVLIGWFAAVIAALGIVLFLGFLAFAPQLMGWVEEHPGSIEQGIVRDFVQWYRPEALNDAPVSDQRERVTVVVEPGMTDAAIGQLLEEKGLVRSQLAFQYAVFQAGRSGTLAAGSYDLSPTMTPSEIIATLQGVPFEETQIRIGEGWRLEQIVAALRDSDLTMNVDEFVQLVTDPPADLLNKYAFFADLPEGRSLEGYLPPNTYRIERNLSAREVVEFLLDEFDKELTPELRDQITAQEISIDDAVTLASIVEREAVLEEERPLIAGVYLNRIKHPEVGQTAGLLNADPTLQYAEATNKYLLSDPPLPVEQWGDVNWWEPLQAAGGDIGADWPESLARYQTYVNPGLPPSPIATPRASSLAAVANPQGDFYYFVAACPGGNRDGSHYFSATYAEHQANVAKANAECNG